MNNWSETLDKLENLEPTITKEETMKKSLSEWRHFQETGQIEHGGGNPNKRKGGNRHGGGRQKQSRNDDNEDPRGNKNSPVRDCKNCGVKHGGRCNRPLGWINDPRNPRAKSNRRPNKTNDWRDKNKNKNKNITMTTEELNTMLANARRGRDDESDTNDDGSVSLLDSRSSSSRSKQPKEFRRLKKQDQMFVMLDNHGEDGFDSDTTITVADIERSRRRQREFNRKLNRSLSSRR